MVLETFPMRPMVPVPAHQRGITRILKKRGLLGRFDMLVTEDHIGSAAVSREIVVMLSEVIQVPAPQRTQCPPRGRFLQRNRPAFL